MGYRIFNISLLFSLSVLISACRKDTIPFIDTNPVAGGSIAMHEGYATEAGNQYISKLQFDVDNDGLIDFRLSSGPKITPPYPSPGYKWVQFECLDSTAFLLVVEEPDTLYHSTHHEYLDTGSPPVEEWEVTHIDCAVPVDAYTVEYADRVFEAPHGYAITGQGNWKSTNPILYKQDYTSTYGGYSKQDTIVHTGAAYNANCHNMTDNSTFYICIKKVIAGTEKFGWIKLTSGTEGQVGCSGFAFQY